METKVRCIIVDDEPTAREILSIHLAKIAMVEIVAVCSSAVEAFNEVNRQKVDLIFLDINMPEISGLSFAKAISKQIKVIFTTAYREFALEGFDLRAVDYLLKPISFERLLQAIHNYLEIKPQLALNKPLMLEKKQDFIFVRSNRKMVKVNFSAVYYVESLSDYLKIYFKDKCILTRQTISSIEAQFPTEKFMRIHRSFIVSIDCIDSFTNEQIGINQRFLPISRLYKKEVLARLANLTI